MSRSSSIFWKKSPFVKLLLAMMAGIMIQWHFQVGIKTWWIIFLLTFAALISFFVIPFFSRYRFAFITGIFTSILFFSIGAMLTWQKDIRNDKQWIGKKYSRQDAVMVTMDEPQVEKIKSLKATATVSYLIHNGQYIPVKGKIVLYFKKELTADAASSSDRPKSPLSPLRYGTQLVFKKSLQEIKNTGNPGGFDYKRYSLFQGTTHQVYLKTDEFEVLNGIKENSFRKFIYSSREMILTILRKNIKNERELGLAEALLIGYKNDLEQSLVQAYTNTGVVHIIAISGLHLGLIYWLLALILKPLKKKRKTKWLSPVLIITGLWLFSFLAGAQPSILRSALMFTCIVLGESLSKKTSIYNTMAVSAFILLCINPFWLWDVGFQLSYAAVLSIIVFMRPVYNWFYIKNKLLDAFWKMNAVTIAAQLLTVPLSIYHFHQFPNYFLLTNFLAVPLSSVILLGEIFLCAISFIPAVAALAGQLLSGLIWLMNTYIERIEALPFSLWNGLQITIQQVILFFIFSIGTSYWLLEKSTSGLKWGLLALAGFFILRSLSFKQRNLQEKIIVYNVPQQRAIDIVAGRNNYFIGDSELIKNELACNFHLKPARTLYRIKEVPVLSNLYIYENYISYLGKHVLLVDKSVSFTSPHTKPLIDLLIISKKPTVYMYKLASSLTIKKVVFDGSVPAWKAASWKKECDSLHIPWHDVTTNGAFVMNLN